MDKSRLLNMISIQYEAQGVQRDDANVFAKEVLRTGKIPDNVFNRMPVEFRDAFKGAHPLHPDLTRSVLDCIYEERAAQDTQWGESNHTIGEFFLIAAEQQGDAAKAAVRLTFDGQDPDDSVYKSHEKKLLDELVHATAVNVAIIERILRAREARSHVPRETS